MASGLHIYDLMFRLLSFTFGLSSLSAILGLLSLVPGPALPKTPLVWMSSRPAIWQIQEGHNAEMEALKSRIETLQGRVTVLNQTLTASLETLQAGQR